jgi:hypothetical protein
MRVERVYFPPFPMEPERIGHPGDVGGVGEGGRASLDAHDRRGELEPIMGHDPSR